MRITIDGEKKFNYGTKIMNTQKRRATAIEMLGGCIVIKYIGF